MVVCCGYHSRDFREYNGVLTAGSTVPPPVVIHLNQPLRECIGIPHFHRLTHFLSIVPKDSGFDGGPPPIHQLHGQQLGLVSTLRLELAVVDFGHPTVDLPVVHIRIEVGDHVELVGVDQLGSLFAGGGVRGQDGLFVAVALRLFLFWGDFGRHYQIV